MVKRLFTAQPNHVADITYIPTWGDFVYTALIVIVFGRLIVSWRVKGSLGTDFALDALDQA